MQHHGCFFPQFLLLLWLNWWNTVYKYIHWTIIIDRIRWRKKKYKQNGHIIKLLSCSNRRSLKKSNRAATVWTQQKTTMKRNRENISNGRWILFIVLVVSDDAQGRTGSAYTILSYDQSHWCDWIAGIFFVSIPMVRIKCIRLKVCNVLARSDKCSYFSHSSIKNVEISSKSFTL